MSHELHVTTSQNYAHTQDVLEGKRNKLRQIEEQQAKLRNEANMAEANRAHHLARVGNVLTHPSYTEALPTYDAQKKLFDERLEKLAADHAAVKADVDQLEGNPTQDSIPRSKAEAANHAAIQVINSISSNQGVPDNIDDALALPAVSDKVDDPNKSFGTIQAALMVAKGKEVERVVRQNIEANFDRESAGKKFEEVAVKAVQKAVAAPAFGEKERNEVQLVTESYPEVQSKPSEIKGPEWVDTFEGQTHLDGTEDHSVSGLAVDVDKAKKAQKDLDRAEAEKAAILEAKAAKAKGEE